MARRGRPRTRRTEEQETSRVSLGGRAARTEDETATCRVYLTAVDPQTNKPLPNNITKTLYIKDISVSDAAEQIAGAFE